MLGTTGAKTYLAPGFFLVTRYMTMIFSDRQLAQRLERTEARANASIVEAHCLLQPASNATWIEVAGAYAMFDGEDSPLTQSFGLGLFGEVGAAELTQIERFFGDRQVPVYHEVSPMADAALLEMLPTRGYRPVEYTNVLYRPLSPDSHSTPGSDSQVSTRRIKPEEGTLWAQTAAAGWSTEGREIGEFILQLGQIMVRSVGTESFLAELDGEPVAAAGLFVHEDVALLMGASTVPAGRRQGAQSALLAGRLRYAAEQGCTLAMMGALPGSQSQRNAEKNGFRIAYTRIKWQLEGAAT